MSHCTPYIDPVFASPSDEFKVLSYFDQTVQWFDQRDDEDIIKQFEIAASRLDWLLQYNIKKLVNYINGYKIRVHRAAAKGPLGRVHEMEMSMFRFYKKRVYKFYEIINFRLITLMKHDDCAMEALLEIRDALNKIEN
jgi:hypothetical protein